VGKQFAEILPAFRDFIEHQHIFFTGSATSSSRVNISPRSTDALRVLGPNQVAYLDQTGSGNETAAHMLADGRMTIMFCAFDGAPMILRLYGRGRCLPKGTDAYAALLASAFSGEETPGARQIVVLDVDLVQSSCGYAVPLFDHVGERDTLRNWAVRQGEDGLAEYWRTRNAVSIDGLPTSGA
jgi:Pyridoxamine 5'-phosphate oxidase